MTTPSADRAHIVAAICHTRRQHHAAALAGQRGFAAALRDRLWLLQVRLAYARRLERESA